jgi:hypothetical protein
VIFPEHCKVVGTIKAMPAGRKVYFLTRYLIRESDGGCEVVEIAQKPGKGIMRDIEGETLIAGREDCTIWPVPVSLHDRAGLIEKACSTGKRCTVFCGLDEHRSFVADPDPDSLLTIHIYDAMPPRPHLSATIRELEAAGLFGEAMVRFEHHFIDVREIDADLFPCRAAGFDRTLDADRPVPGERVAACLTGRQILGEVYGGEYSVTEICPLAMADTEPYIARCCRSERSGTGRRDGLLGSVVHWGASPRQIAEAVWSVAAAWRDGQ